MTAAGTGGFGWLDYTTTSTDACTLDMLYNQVSQSTGASLSASACQAKMNNMVNATQISNNNWSPAYFNRVTYIPMYDTSTAGSGGNASYHISGFAAFYMTGYQVPSLGKQANPRLTTTACASNAVCVYGWFVRSSYLGSASQIGSATQPNFGLTLVSPVG